MNTDRTVPVPLSAAELAELSAAFADLINYEAEDPTAPIDPLTYRAPEGDTCLHVAAYRGDVRAVKLLLKAGLDPTALGDISSTPLHCASDPEVYRLLLAAGASADAINEFGQKPRQQGAVPGTPEPK